jgi:hypothetical protein
MKKTSALTLLAILSMTAFLPGLLTVPVHAASSPTCQVTTSDVNVPAGSTRVLSITYQVNNDEDTGLFGYWALDSYLKSVDVYQTPGGSFYAAVFYSGTFTTFAGALSPEAGAVQAYGGTGSIVGGYILTFTGTLNPNPAYARSGFIGTFDFGGTKSDILLGTYALQSGDSNVFSYLSTYFSSYNIISQSPWGWLYSFTGIRPSTWCNSESGNYGDIITSPPVPTIPSPPVLNVTLNGQPLKAHLIQNFGSVVLYNVPGFNGTKDIFGVDAITTCLDGNGNVRISGYFSESWVNAVYANGFNSTEVMFGDYGSFISSSVGWSPLPPACG